MNDDLPLAIGLVNRRCRHPNNRVKNPTLFSDDPADLPPAESVKNPCSMIACIKSVPLTLPINVIAPPTDERARGNLLQTFR
jgi:hypothetical protein